MLFCYVAVFKFADRSFDGGALQPYSIGFWISGCWTARGVPFCVR